MNEDYSRFERTRIIGARALQIAMGAPILIKTKQHDPKKVAEDEFLADVLPITAKMKEPKKAIAE